MPDDRQTTGLPIGQEPKYTTDGSRIINRVSGEAIPADEPVFVLRARDRHARAVISYYAMLVSQPGHVAAVHRRAADFEQFARAHPERMKEPDTETLR